ncbi:MAG: alpha/beta hydrolase [Myxococcales bacterium]|nr:alpha/beta hydrolase [Myxococcales bacterium]
MPTARCNDIEICYETFGRPQDRPLVLIMGMGRQLIHWPDPLCDRLAERGHYVVRFDNRDMGESTSFEAAGPPDLLAVLRAVEAGESPPVAYDLSDMARDVVGLMEVLGVNSAHLAGVSLGGMVAQTLAIEHPGRVLTLTSLFSTTGRPGLPGPSEEGAKLLAKPAPGDFDGYVDHTVESDRVLTGPHVPFDSDRSRHLAALAYRRGHSTTAILRQLAAVAASGSRHERLAQVQVPTLVVHGDADPLIDIAAGRDTAECIPNARFLCIPGLGHALSAPSWDTLVDEISRLTSAQRA